MAKWLLSERGIPGDRKKNAAYPPYPLFLGIKMKKIFLLNILIVTGVSFLQAQPSRLDSVITKFQNDNRSFEEFVLLGKIKCYDSLAGLENTVNGRTGLYFSMYANLYNSLAPFTRLFKEQSIKKSIDEYFLLNRKYFEIFNSKKEKNNKGKSNYCNKLKLCDCLFDNNENYKKQYLRLVSDKENYITPTDDADSFSWEEIELFRKNYLENYFIKILTE